MVSHSKCRTFFSLPGRLPSSPLSSPNPGPDLVRSLSHRCFRATSGLSGPPPRDTNALEQRTHASFIQTPAQEHLSAVPTQEMPPQIKRKVNPSEPHAPQTPSLITRAAVMGQRACPFGAIKTSGISLESTRNCSYWTPAEDRLQITNRGDGSKKSQQRRTSG